MKLINSTFDSKVLNDHMYNRHGRVRCCRPARYEGEHGILDFEQSELELDRTIGHVYKAERMYQPRKQKMRVRWTRGRKAHIEWWDERPGGAGHNNWHIINNKIDGHIKKWLGRRFDDCFSDLKRKFHEDRDWRIQANGIGTRVHRNTRVLWMAIQDRFLDSFDGRWADHGIDEDGIIYDASVPRKKPSRDIVFYGNGELYWEVKPKNLEICRCLLANLPSNVFRMPLWNGRLDNGTILRLRSEIENSARIAYHGASYENIDFHKRMWSSLPGFLQYWADRTWRIGSEVIDFCFEMVDTRERVVLKYGSPEYKRYKAERNKRKPDPDTSTYYDRSLWVQKYIKKHGGTFHELMTRNPDDINREKFIGLIDSVLCDIDHYTGRWGVPKQAIKEACKQLVDSDWYRRNWVPGSPIANQMVIAELAYIINHNSQNS